MSNFLTRNPGFCAKNARKAWATRKAMREHRKLHPRCALCEMRPKFFGRAIPVHHRIPVHVRPDLAASPSNLVSLCSTHHFWVGHLGNYRDWNTNIDKTIAALRSTLFIHAESGKEMERKG